MDNVRWEIVTTAERFLTLTKDWKGPIACDVETAKNVHLLGISFSNGFGSFYIPITSYLNNSFSEVLHESLRKSLTKFILAHELVGHNFTYDKRFIDSYFGINSNWCFDTRIGWHLASAPSGPRPYGLKDAQIELLGWESKGDVQLKKEVEAAGGRLKNGDHYLASLSTLARYACLDTYSAYHIFKKLEPFYFDNDYGWMMVKMMEYNLLLEANTAAGILVDRTELQKAHDKLIIKAEAAKKRFNRILKQEITELEEDWKDRKLSTYKREYNKVRYSNHPEEWERFNFNSDVHKRELFFDKLGMPVVERTAGGLTSTGEDALKQSLAQYQGDQRVVDAIDAYLVYEKANTITTNFSRSYLDSSVDTGRLHPGFNICGTVSYRLSGFKPYLLNAPFDEKYILKHIKCDPGYVGVHADLSAIEPTITAHYSGDPALVKVFGQGLGDIYLDLALFLFPHDEELKRGYNPNIPITKAVKEKFAKQRKVAKVIQLAVQYTGTGHTVSRNLTKEGIPTSVWEAEGYVRAYWQKFHKVHEMNQRLFALNRQEGHLRNVIGRIIQVPDPDYKDLPNRFIQSSAHDVLILWVGEIYRLCKERGIAIKPVVLDIHDSTSNQVPEHQRDALISIYNEALDNTNHMLGLDGVRVTADIKTFYTLAGLKGSDV